MNEKAFNLFTALVAALLLMLTVLLVNSMTQSERKTADTIAGIQSRSDLEAVAEMERTDAMQIFNFFLRSKIEDWLTREETGGLTLQLQNRTWQEIQTDFAESKFGGANSEALAKFISSNLIGLFYSGVYFENYIISLEGSDTLQAGLDAAIKKSVESGDFFTVIECPNGDPKTCAKGTFYVNLHLEKLTQEEYERLPKLHVVDKITGKDLRMVILPRTTFRIYVPLRFFKAIAETRALMHYPKSPLGEEEDFESFFDTTRDIGLFSPTVHNTIEEMALGMCDYGYCAPRNDPFMPPKEKSLGSGQFCPGDTTALEYTKGILIPIECPSNTGDWCKFDGVQYNANTGSADMKKVLKELAIAKTCDVVKKAKAAGYVDSDPDDNFTLIGDECDSLAKSIEINVEALKSKKVQPEEGDSASIAGFSGSYNAESCDRSNPFGLTENRNLGLYKAGNNVASPHISFAEMQCSGDTGQYYSECAEVSSIKVTLAFKEEDPAYMVNKQGEKVYRITVYDNTFVSFTANWDSGEIGSDCLYSTAPNKTNCSLEPNNGWYCKSMYEIGTPIMSNPSGNPPYEAKGCKPA
jgi:hypothetical protein